MIGVDRPGPGGGLHRFAVRSAHFKCQDCSYLPHLPLPCQSRTSILGIANWVPSTAPLAGNKCMKEGRKLVVTEWGCSRIITSFQCTPSIRCAWGELRSDNYNCKSWLLKRPGTEMSISDPKLLSISKVSEPCLLSIWYSRCSLHRVTYQSLLPPRLTTKQQTCLIYTKIIGILHFYGG